MICYRNTKFSHHHGKFKKHMLCVLIANTNMSLVSYKSCLAQRNALASTAALLNATAVPWRNHPSCSLCCCIWSCRYALVISAKLENRVINFIQAFRKCLLLCYLSVSYVWRIFFFWICSFKNVQLFYCWHLEFYRNSVHFITQKLLD